MTFIFYFVNKFSCNLATLVSKEPKMFKRPGYLLSHSNHQVLFNIKSIKLKHEWILPQGYDTGIKINCRRRKTKVPLILQNKNFVKCYLCGPTVYDVSHIGHASCYIRFDILNRILREFFDIRPIIALGITDIDDKIIIQASKRKMDFRELARQYELDFFNNLNKLNVLPPAFVLRVSEHVPDIIDFILKIIEKGDAYAVEDGSVYFSGLDENIFISPNPVPLKPGQKKHSDFALWKGAKPGEPFWDSPWGKGRPGWHIECSAMASKLFGSQLDLHGGGIDLEFPHHQNEELQSCSYHGCQQWVNYWLYAGLLQTVNEDEKMSKSLGNYVTIPDYLKSYSPDTLRMFCFITKYDKGLHYGPDAMTHSLSLCTMISKFLADSNSYIKGNWFKGNISESALLQDLEETKKKVREHLEDDFNTACVQVVLIELIKKTVKALNEVLEESSSRSPTAVHAVSEYVRNLYKSFGFQLKAAESSQMSHDGQKFQYIVDQIVNFRCQVRAEALGSQEQSVKGNLLSACDSLRKNLGTVGVVIKDQEKNKTSWSFLDTSEIVSSKSTV